MARFIFEEPAAPMPEDLLPKKADAALVAKALERLQAVLPELLDCPPEREEERLRALAEELGMKLGDMLMPLRVAVTGSKVSPPLMESIHVMGAEKAMGRVSRAIAILKGSTARS
jgi:glutamyl-tRNA synthetase